MIFNWDGIKEQVQWELFNLRIRMLAKKSTSLLNICFVTCRFQIPLERCGILVIRNILYRNRIYDT